MLQADAPQVHACPRTFGDQTLLVGCNFSVGAPPSGWPATLRGGRTTLRIARLPVTELSAPADFTLRPREAQVYSCQGEAS